MDSQNKEEQCLKDLNSFIEKTKLTDNYSLEELSLVFNLDMALFYDFIVRGNISDKHSVPVIMSVMKKLFIENEQQIELIHVYRILSRRYLYSIMNIEGNFMQVDYAENEHISSMLKTIITNEDMPIDKISRWFGFIQGVLTVNKVITVEEERQFTRMFFSYIYRRNNEPHTTISLKRT